MTPNSCVCGAGGDGFFSLETPSIELKLGTASEKKKRKKRCQQFHPELCGPGTNSKPWDGSRKTKHQILLFQYYFTEYKLVVVVGHLSAGIRTVYISRVLVLLCMESPNRKTNAIGQSSSRSGSLVWFCSMTWKCFGPAAFFKKKVQQCFLNAGASVETLLMPKSLGHHIDDVLAEPPAAASPALWGVGGFKMAASLPPSSSWFLFNYSLAMQSGCRQLGWRPWLLSHSLWLPQCTTAATHIKSNNIQFDKSFIRLM